MSDVLDTLKSYPDDASIIMSKRVVEDIIDEIARLRVERDAVRAELSDALVLAAQHLDCFRTERWELGNVMRERDALRAELAAARNEHENLILMWRNETAEIEKALTVVEAERDALRGKLKAALVRQEYFDEELEVAEGRIWEEITTADATIIDLRAKLDTLRAMLLETGCYSDAEIDAALNKGGAGE